MCTNIHTKNMNINYLKNSKDLEVDNAIISKLTVKETLNGTFNIAPSNIQTTPPNTLTVNEISKLIGTQGSLVDTNTSDQIIQSDKKIALSLKADINNGYYALRYDCTPTVFLHSLSYDSNSASIFACASDDQIIRTGFLVGCKPLNQKASTTINKFYVSSLGSQANSTSVKIEDIDFLTMNSTVDNRFKLTSLDSISIGSTLTNQASLFINKQGNANIKLASANNEAAIQLSGQDNTIYFGPTFKINNNVPNPEILRIYKSPTVSIMDFNSTTGCVSIGDNNGSTGLPYISLNVGNNNKVLKLPNMNNAQQNSFVAGLSGSGYLGATFLNTQTNRLCFVDNNNILHFVGGTVAASGNNLSVVVESSIDANKTATLLVDNAQNSSNFNVYMPISNNVSLYYLEGMSGGTINSQLATKASISGVETLNNKTMSGASNTFTNIPNSALSSGIDSLKISSGLISNTEFDTLNNITGNIQNQLDDKVTLTSQQTITANKIFESSVNNNNNIEITNVTSANSSIAFSNSFSVGKNRIRKVNDDFELEIGGITRTRFNGDNVDLVNGGSYLKNGVNIAAVAETLTNKSISYTTNTFTGVASISTSQTISGAKTFSNILPITLSNATEGNIRYTGSSPNLSLRMNTANGFIFKDDTNVVDLMSLSNANGLNILAAGKLKVNGNNVYRLRNSTTTNPLVTSDSSIGYEQGSEWFNTTTQSRWICDSASVGAARWKNTNLRSVTFQQYTSNNLLTLESPVYFTADYYVYNKINIIFSTDGVIQFSLYNLSTATNLVSQNTTTSGPDVITINIPSAPYIQPANFTFRVDMKLLSGTTMSMYAISTE